MGPADDHQSNGGQSLKSSLPGLKCVCLFDFVFFFLARSLTKVTKVRSFGPLGMGFGNDGRVRERRRGEYAPPLNSHITYVQVQIVVIFRDLFVGDLALFS